MNAEWQQANEAEHRMVVEALAKIYAAGILDNTELSLICWHCGIRAETINQIFELPRKAA